ncbi:MAG: hypothetical protein ACHQ52_04540 [Candidatus Eisenbacteria bacterium]
MTESYSRCSAIAESRRMVRSYHRTWSASITGAIALACLLTAALPLTAHAAFPMGVPDRVRLSAGGLFAGLTTSAQLSLQGGGAGTTIDGERDLGLPQHQQVLRLEGNVRLLGPLSVDLGWQRFHRSANRVLPSPVTFGELTFTAGSQVASRLDTDFPYAAMRMDLVHTPLVRVGPSLGVSYVTLDAAMSGNAGVLVAGSNVSGSGERTYKQSAPVPLIGIEGEVSPWPRTAFGGWGRWFDLTFEQFSGSMSQWGLHADYFMLSNIGVGIGYEQTRVDFRRLVIDPVDATLDYTVSGMRLSADFAF